MNIPFTADEFLEVFKIYNNSVFPVQIIFYIFAAIAVFLAIYYGKESEVSGIRDRAISFILAFLWLWMGVVYHIIFFTAINKAAYLFGALFIVQGILFLFFGVLGNKISYRFHKDVFGFSGMILIAYSLIVYPVLGYFFDHIYPYSPTFGLPCPTTIFTFGLMLMNIKKNPFFLLIIPLLWSVIGFMAALRFDIFEDTGLLISGLLVLYLKIHRKRN